ncbi:malate dehydrogenase [Mesorhizobium sp. L-8-10]|uniref:Ldh family oxidoreductase n=1 Tax=unclassified Mesorhizobium TaxID=325217 RepID=UPI001925B6CC|nr:MULTISPECIES: Ldh family oxidoreductase [unclassified Mesorhizobium]BCH21248.1 malate dehydrogenase [Mesorhizobium sp. L-8-3]BCH29090.1 malate dehydrogenase [Mesorhizobium sp. L-8-10]
MEERTTLTLDAALVLCEEACLALGASSDVARSLATSIVAAEADGQPSVGFAHFLDYLDAMAAGRIDAKAEPAITRPAPAIVFSDARGGIAHLGFDRVFDDLVGAARSFGLAAFVQKNAFTCGALGFFAGRLAEKGLVAFAATNGPAIVAPQGATRPVYCTNPLAFAAPRAGAAPLLVDQSSSATAFVNVRAAADAGRPIPEGWAIDAEGQPTTDAPAAVKGALLAFGGTRGANIALMVEVLAAGLSGANWSLDAPPFGVGSEGPGTGLFVLALDPKLIEPDFETRLAAHTARLAADYQVHIPGPVKVAARDRARQEGVSLPTALHRRIAAVARDAAG